MNTPKSRLRRLLDAFNVCRQMRDEIFNLRTELSRVKEDVAVARQRGDTHYDAREAMAKDFARQRDISDGIAREAAKTFAENRRLRSQLRDQNEADLLLVSMRIQKRVLDGEAVTATDPDCQIQKRLADAAERMRNESYPVSLSGMNPYSSGPLGQLGMMNVSPYGQLGGPYNAMNLGAIPQ